MRSSARNPAATLRERIHSGCTVVFVSHDESAVRQICTHAVWIEHGRSLMHGAVDEVFAAYHLARAYADRDRCSGMSETMAMDTVRARDITPICVDLDGTLIRSDLLLESALALLRRNPAVCVAHSAAWLLRGKAALKHEIATAHRDRRRACCRTSRASSSGCVARRRTVGECCAPRRIRKFADAVAAHVGGFDDVLASDGRAQSRRRDTRRQAFANASANAASTTPATRRPTSPSGGTHAARSSSTPRPRLNDRAAQVTRDRARFRHARRAAFVRGSRRCVCISG